MGIKKIILLVAICTMGSLYPQRESHIVRQLIRNWPAGCDTTGVHWIVFNPNEPWVKVLNDTSTGSFTNYSVVSNFARWNADVGNFPSSTPWTVGDTIIAFGSWDSAYANNPATYGDNPNHTGFYWLFSDTLTTQQPQTWQPDDTLRPMLKPIAYLQDTTPGVDTIIIKIPNPSQTQGNLTVYDLVGFELFVAIDNGIPNNYNPIVYIPCQGGYGDTTVYKELESNYTSGSNIYYAYKIVVRQNAGTK